MTANPADDRVRAAAISRDGNYLAFDDETGSYVRQIDTGETHPIALPQGLATNSLGWFPDSIHMIAALSRPGQPSGLWGISAWGGSARKLVADARSVEPDGKRIAYIAGRKLREQVSLVGTDSSLTSSSEKTATCSAHWPGPPTAQNLSTASVRKGTSRLQT